MEKVKTPAQGIVIVGGVAGGMSAATRARRLDENCKITVFERGPYVGYANCGIPYALGGIIKQDSSLILQTPQSFKARFNIDVHTDAEVIGIDRKKHTIEVRRSGAEPEIEKVPYSKLILSQGAEPFKPPIPGLDSPNVFMLQTIPDLQKIKTTLSAQPEGQITRAAIIGGGFIGLEAADALRELGCEIHIIEYLPHVFPPLDTDLSGPLHDEIRRHGVKLHLNARIQSIESSPTGRVVLANEESIPADLILVVVGQRARTSLAQQAGLEVGKKGVTVNQFMQTSDPDIYAVGDMVETSNRVIHHPMQLALAGPANRQGRLAADNIFGRHVAYRGNVGTSACKVFDLTVATVGFGVEALQRMGKDPEWVTVHPPHHAGYYPGSHILTLKLIFERSKGVILGAQIVGIEGVDKRIDVLATAMQARMTVFDLEHLELAYAPPYGSAKDAVNMAGFVASNVLRGDVEIVHANDARDDVGAGGAVQWLDVRSPSEFARGHVPMALNIPLNELRSSMDKLDKSKKVIVYCQVGYRGYLGYRILKQLGFEVVNLDGGYLSVCEGGYSAMQSEQAQL